MELGYTGVAYNHSIKGAMSNSDTCAISLIPLSSILQVAPQTLFNSVKFHRELLNVPVNNPFRQYTRLTVAVDSLIQVAALNSGNPVLKTYDLVAVKPSNQTTFEQACKVAEVDLIVIDFSEKVPFRMDFQNVKAAIKRGIYFEITYSHLISDIQTRRQMITNSKLLVEWTRGKNLIFSSAAASASELRGPYDVANLSSLLGLSMKHAKAAISKNCRSVNSWAHLNLSPFFCKKCKGKRCLFSPIFICCRSLLHECTRKKQYYQNAIKVERIISSTKPVDSKEAWFCDGDDYISSREGDLLLNDVATKIPKISKAIDFASIAEKIASNGFPLKDWLSPSKLPNMSK
ncbi:hypothetical protein AQUCO_02700189v1 [Aquilegia coerulea]|uniref:Uncharacterized protein n=1 Tax=Aquilegia coerulea TaxID=218851 RepID=A0A2G5D5N4_AQUCA|nr:hypothetical protein AQUCO_02700189v1 [Aquilegia coerulea]